MVFKEASGFAPTVCHFLTLNMSATTAATTQQAQSQMHEVDPISKFKLLIPPLKESLAVRHYFFIGLFASIDNDWERTEWRDPPVTSSRVR